jgi:hypothetical protein
MKPTPQHVRLLVTEAIVSQPAKTYFMIAQEFGITEWMVARIAVQAGVQRPWGRKKQAV